MKSSDGEYFFEGLPANFQPALLNLPRPQQKHFRISLSHGTWSLFITSKVSNQFQGKQLL